MTLAGGCLRLEIGEQSADLAVAGDDVFVAG